MNGAKKTKKHRSFFLFLNILKPVFIIKYIVFYGIPFVIFYVKFFIFSYSCAFRRGIRHFYKVVFSNTPPMEFTSSGFFVNGLRAFPSMSFNARAGVSAFVIKV